MILGTCLVFQCKKKKGLCRHRAGILHSLLHSELNENRSWNTPYYIYSNTITKLFDLTFFFYFCYISNNILTLIHKSAIPLSQQILCASNTLCLVSLLELQGSLQSNLTILSKNIRRPLYILYFPFTPTTLYICLLVFLSFC